jgi:uncharacterized protein YoaH (UPF0181 family)
VEAIQEAMAVAVYALIALALVAALVFEWRDDHSWDERQRH